MIGVFFCVFFRLVLVSYLIASRKPQYSLNISFEFFLPFEKIIIRKKESDFVW